MTLARLCALALLLTPASLLPAAEPVPPTESRQQHDARMEWFRQARFGLFVHWGLFALPAGEWQGKPVPGFSEWLMNSAHVSVADYARLAPAFNPTAFNAQALAQLAQDAGMKYLVITAKHHDGFAMFASKASPYNIHDATPFGRDVMAEVAAACHQRGLRLGFYYSHSQDWHHTGGAGNSWDPAQQGDFDAYLQTIAIPQVRELLSNYGQVDLLWYDTPRFMTAQRAAQFLPLHRLQPQLIFNNRLRTDDPTDAEFLGDTVTPEQFIPPCGYPDRDWETCMTLNENWGYKKADEHWKSSDDVIRKLSDIASKGGNFLLNIGPDAQGRVPEASQEILRSVGAWLKRNGTAIYSTHAGPFQRVLPWGRTTARDKTLYLHIWNWPADAQLLLPGVHQLPLGAEAHDSPEGLVVKLPKEPLDTPVSIVALEFDQPVSTTQRLPVAEGRLELTAQDAVITQAQAQGNVIFACQGWDLSYSFTTRESGLWRVTAEVSSSGYNRLNLSVPGPFGTSIAAAAQAWGKGPGDFTPLELGHIRLPAGVSSIILKSELSDLRPVQIRRLWLEPVVR